MAVIPRLLDAPVEAHVTALIPVGEATVIVVWCAVGGKTLALDDLRQLVEEANRDADTVEALAGAVREELDFLGRPRGGVRPFEVIDVVAEWQRGDGVRVNATAPRPPQAPVHGGYAAGPSEPPPPPDPWRETREDLTAAEDARVSDAETGRDVNPGDG